MRINASLPTTASVFPVLAVRDVDASAGWLEHAFGFYVRLLIGSHRIQIVVGEGAIVFRRSDDPPGGDSVMVRIVDIDGHCERAQSAGAVLVQTPTDQPYGERQYVARDLDGRLWTFSQTIADVNPSEWMAAVAE